jgi:hypothetical protein
MSFSSLLRFCDHAYLLKHEMAGVASTFTALKFLHALFGRVKRAVGRALGRDVDLEEAYAASHRAAEVVLDAATLARLPQITDAATGQLIPDPRALALAREAAAKANEPGLGVWGWVVPAVAAAILWTVVKWLWRRFIRRTPPPPTAEEIEAARKEAAEKDKIANTPQPVIGPNGQPVLGPNGQPLMTTPAQIAAQQAQAQMAGAGTGFGGVGMGMGGYGGGGYGALGGGYGGYGASSYGGLGGGYGSAYGSGYGGLGGGYGGSYGGMSGYGGSAYGGGSMYGGGYGAGGMYGNSMY